MFNQIDVVSSNIFFFLFLSSGDLLCVFKSDRSIYYHQEKAVFLSFFTREIFHVSLRITYQTPDKYVHMHMLVAIQTFDENTCITL